MPEIIDTHEILVGEADIACCQITSTELEIDKSRIIGQFGEKVFTSQDITYAQHMGRLAEVCSTDFYASLGDAVEPFLYSKEQEALMSGIIMGGDWRQTDEFEKGAMEMLSALFDLGYDNISLEKAGRKSAGTREISVPADYTDISDFTALRSRRQILRATRQSDEFGQESLEVNKCSTFALDINRLSQRLGIEAKEIRLIRACTMFNACDWGIIGEAIGGDEEDALSHFKRMLNGNFDDSLYSHEVRRNFGKAVDLKSVMRRHQIDLDDILQRVYNKQNYDIVQDEIIVCAIEEAIDARDSSLLVPCYTRYEIARQNTCQDDQNQAQLA